MQCVVCVPGDAAVLRRPLPERVDGLAVVHGLLLPRRAAALAPAIQRRRRGGRHHAIVGGGGAGVRGHAARQRPGAHGQGQRVVVVLVPGRGSSSGQHAAALAGARRHPARHGRRGGRSLVVVRHHGRLRGPAVQVGARLQEPAVVLVPRTAAPAVAVVVEAGGGRRGVVLQAQRHGLRLRRRRAQEVLELGPWMEDE